MVRYFFSGRSSERSGVLPVVSSSKLATLMPRLPGVVGLYLRIAMMIGGYFFPMLAGGLGRRR